MQEKDADREKVKTKYMQLADKKPEWVEQIENLLIALEMYRIEEDKAVKRITDFLTAHGIDISETAVKDSNGVAANLLNPWYENLLFSFGFIIPWRIKSKLFDLLFLVYRFICNKVWIILRFG